MKKVLLQDVLENKELGKVLDWWNENYMYEIFLNQEGIMFRKDLQLDEITKYTLNDMVEFYIIEIENKADYDYQVIMDTFGEDLRILKEYKSVQSEDK